MSSDQHPRPERFSAAERAAEKQRSRDDEARALESGAKSRDELQRENSPFRDIAHEPILWEKTRRISIR